MHTCMPVTGVCDRSHAITAAAPRRKANGEAAMRPIRSGTNSSCRPAFPATTMSTGLGRCFGGVHSACACMGYALEDLRPGGPPYRGMLLGTLGLVPAGDLPGFPARASLAIRACCVASSAGRAGEGPADLLAEAPRAPVFALIFHAPDCCSS